MAMTFFAVATAENWGGGRNWNWKMVDIIFYRWQRVNRLQF